MRLFVVIKKVYTELK